MIVAEYFSFFVSWFSLFIRRSKLLM